MLRAPIVSLAVFLVLGCCCQGASTSKPVLTPGDPEIIINEGESLKLICTGSEGIKFHYPDNDGQSMYLLPTSPVTLEKPIDIDDSHKQIVLRRVNAVAGDTGWYGCSSEEDNITLGNYDDPRVSWTYVFVKSNSHYFVNTDELEMLNAVLGTPVKIPCRPTSPDHNVFLTVSNQAIMMGSSAFSYDPKTGFLLRKFSLKDNGYVTCSIMGGNTAEVRFFLRVTRPSKLTEPTILSDTLRHVVRGQTLYVNCTTVLDMDAQYFFNWTTPRQSSKITTRPYSKAIGVNKQLVTCELIIDGVTDEDQGAYTCTIKSHDASKSSTTFVNVYDPGDKYINLTVDGNVTNHQKNLGESVQWVVHVDAYPNPTLKWLDPSGKVINDSWKNPTWSRHAVQTTYTTILTTILRINHIELPDMGLYSLEATNTDQTKTLNFTLEVRSRPILLFGNLENFYMPNQEVKIPCNILAFPRPNVSCSYSRTPNFPSLHGLQILPLKVSVDEKASTAILSVISMTINNPEFGNVTCRACNAVGCDLATVPIWVSDVPFGFDIIKPSRELTVGDELRLTCAASLYNYTSVMWEDEEEGLPEGVEITRSETKYTLRSELLIKNVGLDRNGSIFSCVAFRNDGGDDSYSYQVQIYDSEPPYFRETNMNKTEITFDLSAEEHPTVLLKCYVGGTPTPRLTWYKDDDVIEGNEQYMFLHKNQELHIKYLLDGNGGKYSCKAENLHGKLMNYQIFTIKGKEVSIAWIISMVILLIICVILVIYFSIKMHREKVMRKQLMEAGLTHFEEGALECLNPELTVDDQAELLPYDKKWEFPRERLKFGKQLGSGAFGVVMKAEARGICDEEAVTTVAVKMVRRSTEPTYIKALASELKIMIHLGKHLNVVNLLGACTKNITKRELLVIVEYCRFGNLHNYLLRHRADFINQIDPTSGKLDATIGLDILTRTTSVGSSNSLSGNSHSCSTGAELVSYTAGTDPQSVSMSPDGCVLSNNSTQPGWRSNYSGDYKDQNLKPICTQDLLSWAFQVARGMEYLSQRKVLHGDLAARNILLAENNIVKICDFGLAKTMYKDDNYKKKGDAPLPIKWMAIESIRDRVFSTQSDIWSFGIVLWEFFTLAKTPYPGMEAEKQYQRLIEGYRMEKPEYATDEVYDIMLQCWKAKPTLRPTFTNLVASIGDLLEESVKEHYVDLNAPYLNMNTIVLESGKNDYLTMMSAPDHEALSSPTHYVNSPCLSPAGAQDDAYLSMSPSSPGVESGIFSPRVIPAGNGKFQFPTSDARGTVHSDSESEAVELSPMLTQEEDDNYLKPINVRERRAEFAKQREAALKAAAEMERAANDSGYCNAPRNLRLIDLNAADATDDDKVDGTTTRSVIEENKEPKGYAPTIIRTQDNYVNMPRQKNNLRKDVPDSFSNPSYIMMGTREIEQPGA